MCNLWAGRKSAPGDRERARLHWVGWPMKREVLTTGKTVKNELTRLLLQTAGIHLKTDSNPAFWVTNMRELNPIIYFTLCIGLIMVAISAITSCVKYKILSATNICFKRYFHSEVWGKYQNDHYWWFFLSSGIPRKWNNVCEMKR